MHSLGNCLPSACSGASRVLADGRNSELSTVFALQAYVVVGKQVNRLLQNCIILVLRLKNSFGVNEEGSSGW